MENKYIKTILILVFFSLFLVIRFFENQLFYDPFLNFFKLENATKYPEYNLGLLVLNVFFRYFLNTIISLGIIFLLFQNKNGFQFSAFLFMVLFVIFTIAFVFVLLFFKESYKMHLFYIRRFLIQPLFLLLFLAGFYFQKLQETNKMLN